MVAPNFFWFFWPLPEKISSTHKIAQHGWDSNPCQSICSSQEISWRSILQKPLNLNLNPSEILKANPGLNGNSPGIKQSIKIWQFESFTASCQIKHLILQKYHNTFKETYLVVLLTAVKYWVPARIRGN